MPISQNHYDLFRSSGTMDKINLFQSLLDSRELTSTEALALLNAIHRELETSKFRDRSVYRQYTVAMQSLQQEMPNVHREVVEKWADLQDFRRQRNAKSEDDLENIEEDVTGKVTTHQNNRMLENLPHKLSTRSDEIIDERSEESEIESEEVEGEESEEGEEESGEEIEKEEQEEGEKEDEDEKNEKEGSEEDELEEKEDEEETEKEDEEETEELENKEESEDEAEKDEEESEKKEKEVSEEKEYEIEGESSETENIKEEHKGQEEADHMATEAAEAAEASGESEHAEMEVEDIEPIENETYIQPSMDMEEEQGPPEA